MSDDDSQHSRMRGILGAMAGAQRKKDFAELDRRELSRMSDKDLAEWQEKYPSNSAQFILAQFEWSRRLTAAQIGGMRKNILLGALIGTITTLSAVFLTYKLTHSTRAAPTESQKSGSLQQDTPNQ